MENCYENAVWGLQHRNGKKKKMSYSYSVFQTVLAVQKVKFFPFRFLIISYKKLYRKQSDGFLITEHIFWKNQTWVS